MLVWLEFISLSYMVKFINYFFTSNIFNISNKYSASSEWKLQSYQFSSISQVKEHGTKIIFQIDSKRIVISCRFVTYVVVQAPDIVTACSFQHRKSIELGRTMRPYMIDSFPKPALGSPRNPKQESVVSISLFTLDKGYLFLLLCLHVTFLSLHTCKEKWHADKEEERDSLSLLCLCKYREYSQC